MIEPNYTNGTIEYQIQHGNYTFFSLISFFGLDDFVRFIKMSYIFISCILNLIMIISLRKGNLRKNINPVAFQLISNILVINFIHSFSFMINWVTNLDNAFILNDEDTSYKIGALLIGCPKGNILVCKIQGFMIVFSSLSQDIFINIFFYIINKENIPRKKIIILLCIIAGYICPFVFSIIYASIGGLGLNDRYCYIKKFEFDYSKEEGGYQFFTAFKPLIIILYAIRGINLVISFFLLFKIIKYIRKNNLSKFYILKSSSILIIQIVTFSFSFFYRISRIIFKEFHKPISNIHLCINTLDSILFPLSFSLSNGVYTNLCYKNPSDSSNSLNDGPGELLNCSTSYSIYSSFNKTQKSFPMVEAKNNNNFDLSYM